MSVENSHELKQRSEEGILVTQHGLKTAAYFLILGMKESVGM